MARIIFALMSLACIFHTLAAPLDRRAVTSAACNSANVAAFAAIESARTALGAINTSDDISTARPFLEAQLSLLDAINGTTAIADSLLKGAQPAPANSFEVTVSGLQAAQDSLNKIFSFNPNITAVVQKVNATIATGLASAQQAVAINCTTTPDPAGA
ncbi:hypothetical protein B0H10DRAFT_1961174 [Mycena sp. CBHHK59/15]|nr:hypothetical protein B0H10DRAFT_1961174 [Mycena sp. CBHHK59/15]